MTNTQQILNRKIIDADCNSKFDMNRVEIK